VILPGAQGGYYLDPTAYDAYQKAQRRMARRALVVVLAAALIAVAVTLVLIRVTNAG